MIRADGPYPSVPECMEVKWINSGTGISTDRKAAAPLSEVSKHRPFHGTCVESDRGAAQDWASTPPPELYAAPTR